MANQFHIAVELPERGFEHFRVYMASLDGLRAQGWKPSGDHANLSIENVVDENGKRLSEAFDGWDAEGNDAWVSVEAYPPTKRMNVRGEPGDRTRQRK
jgi:hypothetical protein